MRVLHAVRRAIESLGIGLPWGGKPPPPERYILIETDNVILYTDGPPSDYDKALARAYFFMGRERR